MNHKRRSEVSNMIFFPSINSSIYKKKKEIFQTTISYVRLYRVKTLPKLNQASTTNVLVCRLATSPLTQ